MLTMPSCSHVLYPIVLASSLTVTHANANPSWQNTTAPSGNAARQAIQGNWQGALNSRVGKLRLVLKVSKAADGVLKATMDSPDQGIADLQIATFTSKDSYLH